MYELYLDATPNSIKILIMMEELGLEYDIHILDLIAKEHLKQEFLAINKNGKIPVLIVNENTRKDAAIAESGAILFFLAEKHANFLPSNGKSRYQVMQWLMFQMSALGPIMGQFGHFSTIAPEKIPYAIARFAKESQRLVKVMDAQLAETKFIAGEEYSIADIACYPYCRMMFDRRSTAIEDNRYFLAWLEEIAARSAVKRAFEVDLGEILIDRFAKMTSISRSHWLGLT